MLKMNFTLSILSPQPLVQSNCRKVYDLPSTKHQRQGIYGGKKIIKQRLQRLECGYGGCLHMVKHLQQTPNPQKKERTQQAGDSQCPRAEQGRWEVEGQSLGKTPLYLVYMEPDLP